MMFHHATLTKKECEYLNVFHKSEVDERLVVDCTTKNYLKECQRKEELVSASMCCFQEPNSSCDVYLFKIENYG